MRIMRDAWVQSLFMGTRDPFPGAGTVYSATVQIEGSQDAIKLMLSPEEAEEILSRTNNSPAGPLHAMLYIEGDL